MQAESGAGFESLYYSAPDGLTLHARVYGHENEAARERVPLVCLPGLTRNAADFHQLALLVSTHHDTPRRVISFDYRGRGGSEWDKDRSHYNIMTEAEDIVAGLTALDIEDAIFLGTSRGVLIIMVLAATRPGAIKAAIFNDAGPVIEGDGLAQIITYHDHRKQPDSFEDAAALLKDVYGKAFTALTDADWLDYAKATFAEKRGRLAGNFDPAIAEMLKDINLNAPLPTMWPQFDGLRKVPLLTLRGENSKLLSEESVDRMADRHPGMRFVPVPGQGHAPVLHIGDLPNALITFMDSVPDAG
jgi:pimeloyl-ACP methyl ester carboxylesterase